MCCAASALVTSPPVRISVSLSLSSCAFCRLIYILQGSFIAETWPAQPPLHSHHLLRGDVIFTLCLSHGTAHTKHSKCTILTKCNARGLYCLEIVWFIFLLFPRLLLCVIFHFAVDVESQTCPVCPWKTVLTVLENKHLTFPSQNRINGSHSPME